MNPELEKHNARLQAALKLIEPEAADTIIGEAGSEDEHDIYKILIQGAESLALLNWMMAKAWRQAERENAGDAGTEHDALKMQAQSMAVLLQLVHSAYALGIQVGIDRFY